MQLGNGKTLFLTGSNQRESYSVKVEKRIKILLKSLKRIVRSFEKL
jgi:hypothetical protein